MSRSNPSESTAHVAKRWIEYNGEVGSFKHYDKTHVNDDGSQGANIDLGPKLMFLYLDTTYSVTGWSDSNNAGIYANEVKDISNGILTVKCFKGNAAPYVGNWASIKDAVKASGGKFTANIYIAYKGKEGELEIGVLQLKGAAYAEWNEFAKKKGKTLVEGAVSIASHKDGKKGSVKFKTPVFDTIPTSEKSNLEAIELDKELQAFFKAKIAEPVVATPAAATPQTAAPAQGQTPAANPPAGNNPPPPTEEELMGTYGEIPDDDFENNPF